MYYLKKISMFIIIIFFTLAILCISYNNEQIFSLITPVFASQINTSENLITLLEKAKSSEERKKILEENKINVNSSLFTALLVKAQQSFDQKTLSVIKTQQLAGIAIEVAEFTGDKSNLAKALLYYANFEIIEKKDYNPPGLQKALNLFREIGDQKGEALCYYWQSTILDASGDKDKAFVFLDKAFEIFEKINDELARGDCYFLRGQIYKKQNPPDKGKALENMTKAIKIYEEQEDLMSVLNCYQEMSLTCQITGFSEEAGKYLKIKKDLIEQIDPHKINNFSGKEDPYFFRNTEFLSKEQLLINYYTSLGSLYYVTGKYEEAIKICKKAIELSEKSGERSFSEMFAYWHLGTLYSTIGKKDVALKYYLEAMSKDNPDLTGYLFVGISLGHFYFREMKQSDEALKWYQFTLEKTKDIGLAFMREQYKALCIRSIGEVYGEKGNFTIAIEKEKEAVEILEQVYRDTGQFDYYLAVSYDQLGKTYQKKGDKENALLYMNKAIEFANRTYMVVYRPRAYKCLGDFYFDTGDLNMALGTYLEALKIAREIRFSFFLWECYFSLGKTYEKQGNLEEAYNSYFSSIEIIENMRQEFKVEEFKRDFMNDKIEIYEHMIDLLMKMDRQKDAFKYNEKARARSFLDILANQKIDIHHGINSDLVAKEEELRTRIQYLFSDIRQEKSKPAPAQRSDFILEADEELKKLKTEYQQLLEQIKLENPEYMTLISVNPLSIEQIQCLLDNDTVIVEYFLGENKSYVWIISNDSFNTVIIDHGRKEIETLVRTYRECACDNMTIEKIKSDKWTEVSKKLYDMLFKDVEKHISEKTRILITPHRILHYFPFQVLIDNQGKMLVEKYEMAYLPSASVLKYCQDKNILKKDKLLAFELGNFKASGFPPIPCTDREVKSISAFFSTKEIYTGKDMKTDVLVNKGKHFNILHFATHGLLDSGSPLFSSLVFADRRLNVYEIFDLDLKAYLVCLSACKTGLGEEANGDELVGLSRAFIYAGTPTICASLWDVSDKSTSELMERFYFYLKDKNKTEALKLAQLDIMKKYPHPFFWAPFVLVGDWR